MLPKSNIAIFLKDKNGNLEFKAVEKVENVNDPLSVYDKFKVFSSPGGCDSGSPWSARVLIPDPKNGMNHEKRRVVVAVMNEGRAPTDIRSMVPMENCYTYGTKVNNELISWIKKFDSMKLYSGKMQILSYLMIARLI